MGIRVLTFIVLTALIAGCGGSDKTEVKPGQVRIGGPLGEYLQLVEGSYAVEKGSGYMEDWVISVQLNNVKQYLGDLASMDAILSLEMTDEAGKPVNGLGEFRADDDAKLAALLTAQPGTQQWIKFVLSQPLGGIEELPDDLSAFLATSTLTEKPAVTVSSSRTPDMSDTSAASIEEVAAVESSSSGDCSDRLADYEEFVDEYISYIEKAADGDLSALSEATALQSKAERAGRSIEAAGQSAFSECWDDYMRIQSKYVAAFGRMAKNSKLGRSTEEAYKNAQDEVDKMMKGLNN